MIPGVTERVSSLDRLVARWEVSRLAVVPFTLSILSVWPLMVGPIALKAVTGVRPVVPTLVILACWALLAALDVGRGIWELRHPCASRRWLQAVRSVVGDDVSDRALADLGRRHARDPDYRITRADMANAVQVEWSERRNASRRDEGIRLDDLKARP